MSNPVYVQSKSLLSGRLSVLERSQERLALMVQEKASPADRKWSAQQWSLQNEEIAAVRAALNSLDLAMQAEVEARANLGVSA